MSLSIARSGIALFCERYVPCNNECTVTLRLAILLSFVIVSPALSQSAADFVRLKRTSCYGPCPVFEVTVWSTGRVEFLGHRFVLAIGRRQYWVKKDSVKQLFTLARRIGFFTMPQGFFGDPEIVGHSDVTDHAGRFVTVRMGDTTKTVQDDWAVSPGIADLERAIHRIAKTRCLIYKQ